LLRLWIPDQACGLSGMTTPCELINRISCHRNETPPSALTFESAHFGEIVAFPAMAPVGQQIEETTMKLSIIAMFAALMSLAFVSLATDASGKLWIGTFEGGRRRFRGGGRRRGRGRPDPHQAHAGLGV
jgi:hypothetical protein